MNFRHTAGAGHASDGIFVGHLFFLQRYPWVDGALLQNPGKELQFSGQNLQNRAGFCRGRSALFFYLSGIIYLKPAGYEKEYNHYDPVSPACHGARDLPFSFHPDGIGEAALSADGTGEAT
jgi:hypothetical protein